GVERSPQLVAHVREELRLVLARGLELPALDLDLAEEARVLDGERGLCREGTQQLNDLRRELSGDLPKDSEGAEQVLLTDERHPEQSWVAAAHERARHPTVGGRDQDVRQLNRFLRLREPPGGAFPFADRCGQQRLDDLGLQMLGGARQKDLSLIV